MKYANAMPMYYGAKLELFEFAKKMRHAPTATEKLMWEILTGIDFRNYKFRRQHPIAKFIADFYSHSLLLVVEIDGGYHFMPEQKEMDLFRDEDMQQLGISVLRFTNEEIISQPLASIGKLKFTINQLKENAARRSSPLGSQRVRVAR